MTEKRFTLLVASSNREYLKIVRDYAERMGIFRDCMIAFDGQDALAQCGETVPDLVITDIVLAKLDGLSVLESLRADARFCRTKKIIAMSGCDDFLISKSFEYGANFVFLKPIHYQTFTTRVIDILGCGDGQDVADQPGDVGLGYNVMQEISVMLRRLGLMPNMKGYVFVRYAIKLVIDDPTLLDAITGRLYPALAEYFGSTPVRVERNIRHAIEAAWMRGDLSYMDQLFGYTIDAERGKPTNSAFIAGLADHINLKNGRID